jgi:hypothetical protein
MYVPKQKSTFVMPCASNSRSSHLEASHPTKLPEGLCRITHRPHHIMSQQAEVQLPVGPVRVMGRMGAG